MGGPCLSFPPGIARSHPLLCTPPLPGAAWGGWEAALFGEGHRELGGGSGLRPGKLIVPPPARVFSPHPEDAGLHPLPKKTSGMGLEMSPPSHPTA